MPAPPHTSLLVETVIAILPLFGLICVGVVARKAGYLSRHDAVVLNAFAVGIALPGLILSTFLTRHFDATDALLPTVLWITEFFAMSVVLIAARLFKLKKTTIGACLLATFGNTGFIGYPVTTALFPSQLPGAVFIDQFGMSLVLYPAAVIIGTIYGDGAKEQVNVWREVGKSLLSPLFIALGAGILLKGLITLFPIAAHWQAVIASTQLFTLVGAATIPVVLVSIGLRLSGGAAKQRIGEIAVIGLLKLVLMPLLSYTIARYLYHFNGELLAVVTLESAMPPSAASTLLSSEYRLDSDLSVAAFFVLTLASALTIPILMATLPFH